MIWANEVNTETHTGRQLLTGYAVSSAAELKTLSKIKQLVRE